jgi:hypothetical protein
MSAEPPATSEPVAEDPIGVRYPNTARIWNYQLGGKDNFAVDREAMDKIAEMIPDYRGIARANRGFVVRAVRAMTASGIRQFIDLGTGLPTSPNVHEVAGEAFPDAAVVYVDNDPMVIAHNRALQASRPGAIALLRDLRQRQVSPGLAEGAVSRVYQNVDEVELIESFIRRKLRPKTPLAEALQDPKQLASAYRRLIRAGFSSSNVIQALKRISKGDLLEGFEPPRSFWERLWPKR